MPKTQLESRLKIRINEICGVRVDAEKSGRVIEAVFDLIAEDLSNGKTVKIKNFGKFQITPRRAYYRTCGFVKKKVKVPNKLKVKFYQSDNLDKRLSENLSSVFDMEPT